jgi:hypothetical protein
MHLKDTDLLARIDGMNILAPGWRKCRECVEVAKDEWVSSRLSRDNQSFKFDRSHASRIPFVLPYGWGNPEAWGTWSEDYFAKVILPIGVIKAPSKIIFNVKALVLPSHPMQELIVSINGIKFEKILLKSWNDNSFSVSLERVDLSEGIISIDMQFLNPARPSILGITADDNRLLAIGLESIELK